MRHTTQQQGYILFYVLIALSLFASFAVTVLVSTVRDLETSGLELATVRARFAAEGAAECTSFWLRKARITEVDLTSQCNTQTGTETFTITPQDYTNSPASCETQTFSYDTNYPNGTCARVTADILQNPSMPQLCILSAHVDGYSGDCGASESQRSIWFTL